MGLEAVELLIAIEERFKTHISDRKAEKITTVGELYEFIIQRVQKRDSVSCLTASIFYSIRQILLDKSHAKRKSIRPNSLLNELIPQTERHTFWETLQEKLSIDLPRLQRSQIFQWQGDLFPEHLSRIGDLSRECAKCAEYYSITDEFKLGDRQLIWQEVCTIVADVACVEPEELSSETNFVRELGF